MTTSRTTTTSRTRRSARTAAGVAALLAAALLTAALAGLAYSLTREYGVSPNDDLPADLASGALGVAPVVLLVGALVWLGLGWTAAGATRRRRAAAAAAAGSLGAVLASAGTLLGHLAR